jgi:FkbM family methyltransferase
LEVIEMAHYHPAFPCFTVNVCERDILQEPYRLIDVGVRGGLQPHWQFFGDHLEAWGFDPLYEEGVGPLIATNPHPERIRYFNFGLGHEDGKRPFHFLRDNPSSSFFAAANNVDVPDEMWVTATMRRLDSLVADGTLGPVDFMKLDAETYEAEIVRGAREFFTSSGILGIESEASLVRTSRNPRSVFVELYEELAPFGFSVWDAGVQRASRATLAKGYPVDLGGNRYAARPVGKQVVFDILFLSPMFDEAGLKSGVSVERLLKMIATAELYGLQDVGLDILFSNRDILGRRFDVEEAADWLMREHVGTNLTYRQYRCNSITWAEIPTPYMTAEREARITELEGTVSKCSATLAERDAKLAKVEGILEKNKTLAEREIKVAEMQQLIASQNKLIAQKDALLKQKEAALRALHNSRSWRMTAPLRKIMAWLRGESEEREHHKSQT